MHSYDRRKCFFDYLSYFTGRRSVNIYHVTGVYSVSKYPSIGCLFMSRQLSTQWNQESFLLINECKFQIYNNHTDKLLFALFHKHWNEQTESPWFWVLPFYYHFTMKCVIIEEICSKYIQWTTNNRTYEFSLNF